MTTKTFAWKTETGIDFEITIKDEMEIRTSFDEYEKRLEIVSAKINGTDFPVGEFGRIEFMNVETLRQKGQHLLVVTIKYKALNFLIELLNIKMKSESVHIKASSEFADYYNQIVANADSQIKKMKLVEKRRIEKLFNELKDDGLIEVKYHTSHGYSLLNDLDKHDFFISGLKLMKDEKVAIQNKYMTSSDFQDYYAEHKYKVKFKVLKSLIKKAQSKRDQETKQIQEKAKGKEQRKADELFIFGTETLSSVGNLMLHSLGAVFNGKTIKIYTTGMVKFMKNIKHNTTYKIKDIIREEGFKWHAEKKEWQIEDTEENREKTIALLEKYDTKVEPGKFNLQKCWECGNWHYPGDLDEDGYCGC